MLAPDYNSGNEILAMRAAGARIHYCPVDRRMQLDPDAVARLCDRHHPDVLYVIHYVGWPQPMPALVDLCRARGMLLVEDCALSLLSELDERPLGSFGHWSVFCLYKTLPLPNGALLSRTGPRLEALERLQLREAGIGVGARHGPPNCWCSAFAAAPTASGAALQVGQARHRRAAGALDVRRANVGDIGFNLDEVDLAMSPVSARLLERFDFAGHPAPPHRELPAARPLLDPSVARVFPDLPDGDVPAVLPDSRRATSTPPRATLQRRGVDALEFWNESMESGERDVGPTRGSCARTSWSCRFTRI